MRNKVPLKIACVHTPRDLAGEVLGAMNLIRFVRMSEALARRGYHVDLVAKGASAELPLAPSVGRVSPDDVRWDDYDVVKTFFHSGFLTLSQWGGADHPFIVSNLGSVVGSHDTDGVYFFGQVRDNLWAIQQQVAARSRFVSLLTKENADLWQRMHGNRDGMLEVPGGVDAEIPGPGANPYRAIGVTEPVALFAGNIYTRDRQEEVNIFWQERLNRLGRALRQRGVQLVVAGLGDTHLLDPHAVRHVGVIDFREFWNWQWHANVGVSLAQGAVQDNESTKIYFYLRTGLPVACEASIPNAWLVSRTGHGTVVDYDQEDVTDFAEAIGELARRPPRPNGVIPYIVAEHSWDARAAAYASAFATAARHRGVTTESHR